MHSFLVCLGSWTVSVRAHYLLCWKSLAAQSLCFNGCRYFLTPLRSELQNSFVSVTYSSSIEPIMKLGAPELPQCKWLFTLVIERCVLVFGVYVVFLNFANVLFLNCAMYLNFDKLLRRLSETARRMRKLVFRSVWDNGKLLERLH